MKLKLRNKNLVLMWVTIHKWPPTEDVEISSFLREVVVYLRFQCYPYKSTYKLSRLISVLLLEKVGERICLKIKAISFWDNFINYCNPSMWCNDFCIDLSILLGENWCFLRIRLKGLRFFEWENILGVLNLSNQLFMRGAHCT